VARLDSDQFSASGLQSVITSLAIVGGGYGFSSPSGTWARPSNHAKLAQRAERMTFARRLAHVEHIPQQDSARLD
jgi:hypothetical protein